MVMRCHAFRLGPGLDLKKEIKMFVTQNQITAGIVLTCVGSLSHASVRLANDKETSRYDEKFEIVSLVGTLSMDGCHLHISLANSEGEVIGGHLKDDCIIYTTAEIVIAEISNFEFSREFDQQTGWKELKIKEK